MIQWFPGHMAKTKRLIKENVKLADVVLELADARLPQSSRNPLLNELLGSKPRILVLTKEDLAEATATVKWLKHFNSTGLKTIAVNAADGTRTIRKKILESIREETTDLLEKRRAKGIINRSVRTMIVGIPNVGKSTLINFLARKGAAATGDKPGVTRGKQWIRLDEDVELLDMPGLLWPKFEDPEVGFKLAASGAISDEVVDRTELALWLTGWLVVRYPGRLAERYGINENLAALPLLEAITRKRGFLKSGGEAELHKGAVMLVDEFRAGKLGRCTFDHLDGGV